MNEYKESSMLGTPQIPYMGQSSCSVMVTKHLAFEQQGVSPSLPMCILGMMLERYYEHKHITLPKKVLTHPGIQKNSIFCFTDYLVLFLITVLKPLTAEAGY